MASWRNDLCAGPAGSWAHKSDASPQKARGRVRHIEWRWRWWWSRFHCYYLSSLEISLEDFLQDTLLKQPFHWEQRGWLGMQKQKSPSWSPVSEKGASASVSCHMSEAWAELHLVFLLFWLICLDFLIGFCWYVLVDTCWITSWFLLPDLVCINHLSFWRMRSLYQTEPYRETFLSNWVLMWIWPSSYLVHAQPYQDNICTRSYVFNFLSTVGDERTQIGHTSCCNFLIQSHSNSQDCSEFL